MPEKISICLNRGREKLVAGSYANTTNVEFIVDPKVLFHGWLIYSYWHTSWSSGCQGSVQIGSSTSLWHDHIACIDDTACRGRKTILINEHTLNREPVSLTLICLSIETASRRLLLRVESTGTSIETAVGWKSQATGVPSSRCSRYESVM